MKVYSKKLEKQQLLKKNKKGPCAVRCASFLKKKNLHSFFLTAHPCFTFFSNEKKVSVRCASFLKKKNVDSFFLTAFPLLFFSQEKNNNFFYLNKKKEITTFFICKPDKIGVRSLKSPSDVGDLYDVSFVNDLFFNYSFDKNRLKAFILWFYKKNGSKKVIDVIEKLKNIGFEYATKAGISLGIDDLKIPPKKKIIISEADDSIFSTLVKSQTKLVTDTERFQQTIELWNRTSENLKQSVIEYFRSTDPLNPVFMMAFSGARGNISQVRQLVGMRGLMSDPEGNVIDYPIRSNFREGLTLTEYLISCYGARKGVVDTALKTANAGYLTRRLVDVSQHVFVDLIDCNTSFGIAVEDNNQGISRKVSLKDRLVGRVLAEDIKPIAFRNQQIGKDLGSQIVSVRNKVLIRSPLTCQAKKTPFGVRPEADLMDLMEKGFDRKSICQLCYGWSFYQPNLVDLGEAVGIIAGQSIGEPGTQLTMRTFHTGGVFSGEIVNELRAPRKGVIDFSEPLQGKLVRTSYGKIGFLTKVDGEIFFAPFSFQRKETLETEAELQYSFFTEKKIIKDELDKTNNKRAKPLETLTKKTESNFSDEQRFTKNYHDVLEGLPNDSMLIPASTILFVRQGERVFENQLIAENFLTSNRDDEEERVQAEYQVYPPFEGEISFQKSELFLRKKETRQNASVFGFFWILAGKLYKKDYNFDKKDDNPFYSNGYIKDKKKNENYIVKKNKGAYDRPLLFFSQEKNNNFFYLNKKPSNEINNFYPKIGDLIDKTSLLKLSKNDLFGLTGFICNWNQSVESGKTVSNGKKYIKGFIAKQKGLPKKETIKFEKKEKEYNSKFDQYNQVVTSYEGDLLGTGSVSNEPNKLVVNRPMLIKSFKNIQFSNIGYFFSFTNLPTKKDQQKFSMKTSKSFFYFQRNFDFFLEKKRLFIKKETFPNDQFFVSNPFSSKNTFRSSSRLDFKWFPEKYKTDIGGFISFDKNLSFPLNDQTTQPLIRWVPESSYQLGVLTSTKPLTAKQGREGRASKKYEIIPSVPSISFFVPSDEKKKEKKKEKQKNLSIPTLFHISTDSKKKKTKNIANKTDNKNKNNKAKKNEVRIKNINNQRSFITISEIYNEYPLFYRVNSQGKISGEFSRGAASGYSLVFEKAKKGLKNLNRLLPSSYELSYPFGVGSPLFPKIFLLSKDSIYPFLALYSYRIRKTRFLYFPIVHYSVFLNNSSSILKKFLRSRLLKKKKKHSFFLKNVDSSEGFLTAHPISRTPLGDLCDVKMSTFNKNQPNFYKFNKKGIERIFSFDRTGDFYKYIKKNLFRFNGRDCYTYQAIFSKYLLKGKHFKNQKTATSIKTSKISKPLFSLLSLLKEETKNHQDDFSLFFLFKKKVLQSKTFLKKNKIDFLTKQKAIKETDCQILYKYGWVYYPKSNFLEDHQSFLPAANINRSLMDNICFDQVPVFLEYIINKKKDLKKYATVFKIFLNRCFCFTICNRKTTKRNIISQSEMNPIITFFSIEKKRNNMLKKKKVRDKTNRKQYLHLKLGFSSAEQSNVPTLCSLINYTNQINKRLVLSCQPFAPGIPSIPSFPNPLKSRNPQLPFLEKNSLNKKDFLFLLNAIYSKKSNTQPFLTEKSTPFNWHKDCLLDGFQSIFVFVNNKNFYHFSSFSTEKNKKNVRRRDNNFCLLIRKVNQYSLLPVNEYKKTLQSKDRCASLYKNNCRQSFLGLSTEIETKQSKNKKDFFFLKKKRLLNAKKVLGFVKSDIDNTESGGKKFNKQFSTKKGFSFDKYHSKTGKVITPKDRIERLINGHRLGIIKEKEKKEHLLRLLRLIIDWLVLEIGLIIDLQINTLLSLPTNRKRKIFYFTQNQFGQLRVSFQLLEKRIKDEQLLSLLEKNSKKIERLFLFKSLEKTVFLKKNNQDKEQVFEYLFKTLFDLRKRPNFQLYEKNKKLIVTNLLEPIFLYPSFQLRVLLLFLETLIFSLYYQKWIFLKEKRLIFTNLLKPILLDPLVDSQFLVKKNNQLSFVSLQNPAKTPKTLPPNKLLGDILPKDLQSILVFRPNPIFYFSFVRQIDLAQNCSNPNFNKDFLHYFKDKRPVINFSSNFFKETGYRNTELGHDIKKPLDLSLKPRFPSILTTKITKIITDKQFWYSYSPENPLTLTLFFSPYKAEVVENSRPFSFQRKETESSPFSSTFSLFDRYCLLLTETDQISYLSEQPKPRVAVGQLINYGDNLSENVGFPFSGQIIEIEKNKVKLRRAQPVSNLSSGSVHVKDGDFIKKNQPLITTFYQKLTNEDIVQGIPKIEQLFEARRTKQGLPLPGNLPDKLEHFFSIEMKKPKSNRKQAAQTSFAKIQRILIDKIQNVYISQGVTIADKHLEIVVRQMTSKVVILEDHFYDGIFPLSRPWFLPGEFVDLDDAESANAILYPIKTQSLPLINQQQDYIKPFIYKPILLGVTTASLESESFISAASFQETTRILTSSATKGRKDFLHGLKERVILGDLINVGTGSVKIFPFFEPTFFSREFRKNRIREVIEQIVAQMDTLFAQREIIVDQISKILAPISYLEETLKQPLQEVEEILFTDWYKEEYDKYRIRHNLFDSKNTKNLRYINSPKVSLIYKNQIRDFPEIISKQCGVMPYLKEKLKEDKSYLLPPYYGVDSITTNFYFKYTPFFLNSFTDRFAQTTAYIYTQLALIPYLEEKLKEDKSYLLPAHYGVDSITGKVFLKKNDIYLRYLIDHFSQTKTSIVQFFIFLIHTNNKLLKKKE